MNRRHHLRRFLAAALALLAFAPAANAQTWSEAGDAGDQLATAQPTLGIGSLTTITGALDSPTDVDIYCVRIGPTPRALGLPVVSLQCVVMMGPNAWVFDGAGLGLATNETCQAGFKQVTSTTVAPGSSQTMYVAVSYYGIQPLSGPGPIWLSSVPGERSPDGPGAAAPLVGWAGTPIVQPINPYTINLNFATFCEQPVPAVEATWGSLKARYGPPAEPRN